MLIGHFTEQPYQDMESGIIGRDIQDLEVSNAIFNRNVASDLYNRYLDEKLYAEEMGFDAFMLNEHHATPFCMSNVPNVQAAILARQSKKAKIVILGNVLPTRDNPLMLAEELAQIDLISRGRLVSGLIRGGGREFVALDSPPHDNWERFQEAHDFILKTWTTPGPFRWEGKHFQYRYVNPFIFPFQKPHPPIWIPTAVSIRTIKWAAKYLYPIVVLATKLGPSKEIFDLYHKTAAEYGHKSGPQHTAYLTRIHVDETEELAMETSKKYIEGPSNPHLFGNEGIINKATTNLPGHTSRKRSHQVAAGSYVPESGKHHEEGAWDHPFEVQVRDHRLLTGTPKSILPKIRHVLEYLRPGAIFCWDGDGSMTHDDQMRSLRLMGQEVIPAMREMAKELELYSTFEVDSVTGNPIDVTSQELFGA